jgi:heme exporter protein B
MDRLLLCPVDRKAIFAAKLLGNLVFIGAVEVVAVPVFAAIYNVPVVTVAVLPILALGTLGIASLGTLFAAITANTRAREVLLPILVFPLLVPVVISAVKATQGVIDPAGGEPPWLGLIAAFDVIFLSIAAVTFRYVIEE